MSAKGSILVIDDETEIRESLEQLLKLEGYQDGYRRDRRGRSEAY